MFDTRPVALDISGRILFRRWLVAVGATLVALHASSAWAAQCTWTGGGANPDWSTPANWACTTGTVPQAGDALDFVPGGVDAHIVGMVNDSVYRTVRLGVVPTMFLPMSQGRFRGTSLPIVVRKDPPETQPAHFLPSS